ncbi:E3 ubiquitin-protein ligase RNF6 isoform X2 [Pseudorca crassidens]|uniref:E3 ubiquitin-protein ligase RNF6 isoform X2 n=1 Tax=Pseudorca crassidens TaxID=82174 RepID=UPI00122F6563|nr:E3 ubiquitin-protein ligase RNF6 isoform X2 [Globicephala melas]
MNWSRSRPDGGGEETSSQDQNHHENERRWQQERLHREEAYYQFINDLNDEDYRLMRDHNLLGTPGEITSEELQQRLDGVKEQLASQPDLRNGTNTRDSGVPRESSNEESLLEWLNTFRRTGNATRSGQNGNQTWRADKRLNPAVTAHMEPSSGSSTSPGLSSSENQEENKRGNEQSKDKEEKKAC